MARIRQSRPDSSTYKTVKMAHIRQSARIRQSMWHIYDNQDQILGVGGACDAARCASCSAALEGHRGREREGEREREARERQTTSHKPFALHAPIQWGCDQEQGEIECPGRQRVVGRWGAPATPRGAPADYYEFLGRISRTNYPFICVWMNLTKSPTKLYKRKTKFEVPATTRGAPAAAPCSPRRRRNHTSGFRVWVQGLGCRV